MKKENNKIIAKRNINNCPVCNSKHIKKTYKKKFTNFVLCKKCKLIFQNPQEDIKTTNKRYKKKYFEYEVENQFNFFNLIKKTLDDFNILKILPKKAKVLEIGSATGLFLKFMDSLNFESTGIEICKESADYGKKNYNVNILNCRLEDANLSTETFDFIHFSHLIEHLNEPVSFLKKVNMMLKKDGIALITTPNSSGLFAKYYDESWRCIVDDHLFIFNKNNLKKLLKKSNFLILKYKTWGSIPVGKSYKIIKKFFDWFTKKTGTGDVVCFLVKKI